ncbi:MAG: chorismate mutase [Deltaproteobacteria bacterium]|jgi:chorismate mutase/prephenate dehydratase|nr:chorismate mutase [Deltaproteobacteria bacterium]
MNHLAALNVAYLGPYGTFSSFVARQYLRLRSAEPPHDPSLAACPDLDDLFERLEDGRSTHGVVPTANTLGGGVGPGFDLLLRHKPAIRAEFYARIRHCLLSRESKLEDIRVLYSHPQPLIQAGKWLRQHLPGVKTITVDSTAASAARAGQEPGSAGIGREELAGLYSLRILGRSIEDDPDNWTRFILITREEAEETGLPRPDSSIWRSSLLFTLADRPGALTAALRPLAEQGLNLLRLESRPLPGAGRWACAFFADFEGNLAAPCMREPMSAMQKACQTLRLLGTYPTGPYLDEGDLP